MNIDEALNTLQNEVRVAEVNDRPLELAALQLGIEALKHYKQERERRGAAKTMWLQGETKE